MDVVADIKRLNALLKTKASCASCGFGSHKSIGSVLCGFHHSNFKETSLCDQYLTPDQRKKDVMQSSHSF